MKKIIFIVILWFCVGFFGTVWSVTTLGKQDIHVTDVPSLIVGTIMGPLLPAAFMLDYCILRPYKDTVLFKAKEK